MFMEGAYLPGAVATGTVPAAQLLIAPGYAWALILVTLALCCGGLWFLTAHSPGAERTASRSKSSRTKTGGRSVSASRATGKKRFVVTSDGIPFGR